MIFNAHWRSGEIDLNLFVVQLAFAQLLTERLTRRRRLSLLFRLAPVVFWPVGSARQEYALRPSLQRDSGSSQ
ncbi:Uncharacterised protein [Enterobacter cancerogenus]|uniref:Uncharacterized protein n=1 Tax=Enterobacter cancerogenus TaxID=69218 RepID=A0A484YM24_9ENTR|nr:Uncharacterised protein [Enterobacter cancerogenus]